MIQNEYYLLQKHIIIWVSHYLLLLLCECLQSNRCTKARYLWNGKWKARKRATQRHEWNKLFSSIDLNRYSKYTTARYLGAQSYFSLIKLHAHVRATAMHVFPRSRRPQKTTTTLSREAAFHLKTAYSLLDLAFDVCFPSKCAQQQSKSLETV